MSGSKRKPPLKPPKDVAKKLKTTRAMPNHASLVGLTAEQTRKHRKAPNTTGNYEGHIRRGREFLASFLSDEKRAETTWKAGGEQRMSGEGEEELEGPGHPSLGEEDPELVSAFDGHPNASTPEAIALFLAQKCFEENHGISTAVAIHAAFKDLYEQMDGDTFRDRWRYNELKRRWEGSPVYSAKVEDLMEVIKHKCGAEGERHHSFAMSYQDMEKLLAHSKEVCSSMDVDGDLDALIQMANHLRFRALSTTGFTIWTRNNEATQLQYKDFDFNPGDRRGCTPYDPPHFVVSLTNRKNWQKKLKKDSCLRGHRYNIYPQPERPAIDMYSHVLDWLDFYEAKLLGRKLEPEDHIFPTISINGRATPHIPISSSLVQKNIDGMASVASLSGAKSYTTHCFRRGGAQYRFMFAPIGERWTLARIRWWGGWADGEHRDTLIRYLLDELYMYEEDHSDALCPIDREVGQSHAGEAAEMRPMTTAEGRRMFAAQQAASQALVGQFLKAVARLSEEPPTTPTSFDPAWSIPNSSDASHALLTNSQTAARVPAIIPHAVSTPVGSGFDTNGTFNAAPPHPSSSQTGRRRPPTFISALVAPLQIQAYPVISSLPREVPVMSAIIPQVRRGEHGWRDVVKDWEEADESRSLRVALKDWPDSWFKGIGKDLGSKYNQRRLIATEFIDKYHRDEEKFLEAYPASRKGVTDLFTAIRKARQQRGEVHTRSRRA